MPLALGEDALEDRSLATRRQRGRDSRLKHRVTLDHATAMRVEPRTVERMSHLADQPLGGSARQAGIGVERDHVADPGRHGRGLSAICKEGRVGRAAEQAIQLVKFPALAFPPHPLSLRLVPDSPAMEQEKSLPIRRGSVALVQARDCVGGRAEKLLVSWRTFGCGIGPVREQSEAKVAVRTRQIMNLQTLDLLLEFRSRRQEEWAPRPSCADPAGTPS